MQVYVLVSCLNSICTKRQRRNTPFTSFLYSRSVSPALLCSFMSIELQLELICQTLFPSSLHVHVVCVVFGRGRRKTSHSLLMCASDIFLVLLFYHIFLSPWLKALEMVISEETGIFSLSLAPFRLLLARQKDDVVMLNCYCH